MMFCERTVHEMNILQRMFCVSTLGHFTLLRIICVGKNFLFLARESFVLPICLIFLAQKFILHCKIFNSSLSARIQLQLPLKIRAIKCEKIYCQVIMRISLGEIFPKKNSVDIYLFMCQLNEKSPCNVVLAQLKVSVAIL